LLQGDFRHATLGHPFRGYPESLLVKLGH
jgi:hypothetical protein